MSNMGDEDTNPLAGFLSEVERHLGQEMYQANVKQAEASISGLTEYNAERSALEKAHAVVWQAIGVLVGVLAVLTVPAGLAVTWWLWRWGTGNL
jgi:hypothetical protein